MSGVGSSVNVGAKKVSGGGSAKEMDGVKPGKSKGPGHKLDGKTLKRAGVNRAHAKAAPGALFLDAGSVHSRMETLFKGEFKKEELGQVTRPMLKEIMARADRPTGLQEARQILAMEPVEFHDWQQSGITLKHWQDFKEAAATQGFIFVRPVNPLATRLIEEGAATKAMDIHGKSADWGPQAGFIPADQGLSKKAGQKAEVAKGNASVAESLKLKHVGEAPLELSPSRVAELQSRGLLPADATNGEAFTAPGGKGQEYRFKLVEVEGEGQPKYKVLVQNPGEKDFTDLKVLGYTREGHAFQPATVPQSNVDPVTADYDLFATCPHRDDLLAAGDLAEAYKEGDGIRDKVAEGLGKLTEWDERTMDMLNEKMQGAEGPRVVNHGPETSNPFPEADPEIVMFTPSGRARTVAREDLPQIWRDMFAEGYVVPHNEAWTGEDAGIRARTKSEVMGEVGALDLGHLEPEDFPRGKSRPGSRLSGDRHGEGYHETQRNIAAVRKAAAKAAEKKDPPE